MFELSKIVGFLITPLALSALLCATALLLAWRKRTRGAVSLVMLAMLVTFFSAMPYTAAILAGNLERQYAAMDPRASPLGDSIVLLGGGVAGARPPVRPTFDMNSAADRVWHAAALYRLGKAPHIVVAAGNPGEHSESEGEADALVQMLAVLGVPTSSISVERSSRNTRENAKYALPLVLAIAQNDSANLGKPRRVLLVTSALHMPRAIATFRKVWATESIEIVPSSTDVEIADDSAVALWQFVPEAIALSRTSRALKEYVGLIALHSLPVTP
jgi:uncharacterized SAM-binding protein YcdF (DUF218 family)